MRKTTVYLYEEEVEGLRLLSGATGESQAELIREGVRRLLREEVSRKFHSMGKGEGTGEPRPRWNPDAVHEKTLGRD
jgi:Arc/MetJ-type ribon-helix-helix transcriptional regulator